MTVLHLINLVQEKICILKIILFYIQEDKEEDLAKNICLYHLIGKLVAATTDQWCRQSKGRPDDEEDEEEVSTHFWLWNYFSNDQAKVSYLQHSIQFMKLEAVPNFGLMGKMLTKPPPMASLLQH